MLKVVADPTLAPAADAPEAGDPVEPEPARQMLRNALEMGLAATAIALMADPDVVERAVAAVWSLTGIWLVGRLALPLVRHADQGPRIPWTTAQRRRLEGTALGVALALACSGCRCVTLGLASVTVMALFPLLALFGGFLFVIVAAVGALTCWALAAIFAMPALVEWMLPSAE